jgi:4-hydroxybutyrate CoA-transferase
MDWRTRYAEKLTSPQAAAGLVRSGDTVLFGYFTSTPETMANALLARAPELNDVTVHHYVSPFVWATPETAGHFRLVTGFATPADRKQIASGEAEYVPLGNFRADWIRDVLYAGGIDVLFVKTSPPNANGYMSFGAAVWANITAAQVSRQIVCEVDDRLIRTGGDNFIHISQVDCLVEHDRTQDREPPIPPRSEETAAATEVICTVIANELVHDRDTLQIGIGDVSSALALYLDGREDIGIQTEIIPGGVIEMVERGVITGKFKDIAPGKVVGSAFAVLPPEELAKVHENPRFELWDFCHTDDLRVLVQQRNFVAVNNALQIDLTGQVTAETLNGAVFSGPGGQTVFAMAASYCEGGRSIIALPSSSLAGGERHSRILSRLPAGSVITTPRSFVDYVVTEQGVATLRGKTVRERIGELASVAHPDFRAELRREAAAAYNI